MSAARGSTIGRLHPLRMGCEDVRIRSHRKSEQQLVMPAVLWPAALWRKVGVEPRRHRLEAGWECYVGSAGGLKYHQLSGGNATRLQLCSSTCTPSVLRSPWTSMLQHPTHAATLSSLSSSAQNGVWKSEFKRSRSAVPDAFTGKDSPSPCSHDPNWPQGHPKATSPPPSCATAEELLQPPCPNLRACFDFAQSLDADLGVLAALNLHCHFFAKPRTPPTLDRLGPPRPFPRTLLHDQRWPRERVG